MVILNAPLEKLLGALQAVSGIVERRHTLPILANVLIRKNDNEIDFVTSDLEIQVRTKIFLDGYFNVFDFIKSNVDFISCLTNLFLKLITIA